MYSPGKIRVRFLTNTWTSCCSNSFLIMRMANRVFKWHVFYLVYTCNKLIIFSVLLYSDGWRHIMQCQNNIIIIMYMTDRTLEVSSSAISIKSNMWEWILRNNKLAGRTRSHGLRLKPGLVPRKNCFANCFMQAFVIKKIYPCN